MIWLSSRQCKHRPPNPSGQHTPGISRGVPFRGRQPPSRFRSELFSPGFHRGRERGPHLRTIMFANSHARIRPRSPPDDSNGSPVPRRSLMPNHPPLEVRSTRIHRTNNATLRHLTHDIVLGGVVGAFEIFFRCRFFSSTHHKVRATGLQNYSKNRCKQNVFRTRIPLLSMLSSEPRIQR